jgi:uncharacterized protein
VRKIVDAIIDYVEDADGLLSAFEFKWDKSKAKLPAAFAAAYPNHTFKLINRLDYLDFIG